MTWEDRNLLQAYATVCLARNALEKIAAEIDQVKFPTAFGLVKAAAQASWLADKELHSLVADRTERIKR